MRATFRKTSFFSVTVEELFRFHERADAFELLTPASANIEVGSVASTLAPSDDVVRFAVKFGPMRFRFENVHTEYVPPALFVDEQRKGLFTEWRHEHRFASGGWEEDPASMLVDEIAFAHPLLPTFVPFVKHRLAGLFEYRHRVTREQLMRGSRTDNENGLGRVAITGATGLIGKRISRILVEKGAEVVALVRDTRRARELLGDDVSYATWDFDRPEAGDWREALARADAVVHLAGTPLFSKRWNPAFKERMSASRVQGTRQLVDAILASERRPRAFVSASALGIYGTDHTRVVDEESAPADDLLARICIDWEKEARRLEGSGVRAVQMRIGIVLSTESGALKELLPLFKMGMGGVMGAPDPYINWVHIEDVARMFVMALTNEAMEGPYIAAGPEPVTNREFARAIARALRRPALTRFPPAALKLIIGEAGAYASGGPRASSSRIEDAGYRFFFDSLDTALTALLGG
jgi:uncharacterized protein (TIGR01777 family)